MSEATEVKEFVETPEYKAAIEKATAPADLRAIFWQEAAKQGIPVPEHIKETLTPVVEPVAEEPKDDEPKVYYEEIVLGGKTMRFEGDSPEDAFRQVKAAIAANEAAKEAPKKEETKKELTADEKVALELDYRMGRITIEDYMDRSGALDVLLEKKGVKPVTEVPQATAEAWAPAVTEFITANADYVPNPQNEKLMKWKLQELGLPKQPAAASLQKAFDALKTEGFITAPVKTEPKKTASGLFGVGDSTRGGTTGGETKVPPPPQITKDMGPREINQLFVDYYKSIGVNPDDAFKEAIKAKKR